LLQVRNLQLLYQQSNCNMAEEDLKLEDTNCAKIGSEEDKALRHKVAGAEPAWQEAGKKPGHEVWRIEQFHVHACEEGMKGKFRKGDSYIILKTDQGEGDVLVHSIYFWIGEESSQDEYGTAAYKVVELDDYFHGQPTEHREEQGKESEDFKALFPDLEYLDGGVETGFKHVTTNEHKVKVRLFVVRQTSKKKEALVAEIPLTTDQLNANDCFVLNTPETIYCLDGPGASSIEKYEANKYAEHYESMRKDGVSTTHDIDDKFWEFVKGDKPSWAGKLNPPQEKARPAAVSDGKSHTLQELQEGCPDGVLPEAKEQALSDKEFQDVFGMSKADFAAQPKWKQTDAKKKHKLF